VGDAARSTRLSGLDALVWSASRTQKRGVMFAARRITSLQDVFLLLNCRRLPARLNTTETALILGFQEHDLPALIAAKLLSPLGKPAPNSPKFFARVEVLALAKNRDWLSQVTRTLPQHCTEKSGRKGQQRLSLSTESSAVKTSRSKMPNAVRHTLSFAPQAKFLTELFTGDCSADLGDGSQLHGIKF
jgi:hypothetical protein